MSFKNGRRTMAQVNFRVDDKLKTDVESLYRGLGLTLSAAFTLFAHQSLIHRGLPFQVRECPDFAEDHYSERRQVMNEQHALHLSLPLLPIASIISDRNAEGFRLCKACVRHSSFIIHNSQLKKAGVCPERAARAFAEQKSLEGCGRRTTAAF